MVLFVSYRHFCIFVLFFCYLHDDFWCLATFFFFFGIEHVFVEMIFSENNSIISIGDL